MALVNLKPTAKGVTTLIIAAAVGVGVCVLACYGAMRKVDNLSRNLAKMEKQAAVARQMLRSKRVSACKCSRRGHCRRGRRAGCMAGGIPAGF